MSSPTAGFRPVLDAVAAAMKERGWRKQRQDFWSRGSETWRIVAFTRSRFNDRSSAQFFVTLAIAPDVLLDDASKRPREHECPFAERLGGTWEIKASTNVDRLAKRVVKAVVDDGVPLLERVGESAETLRDHWLAEREAGEHVPLSKLIELAEAIGPKKLVKELRSELEEVMERNRRHAEEHGTYEERPAEP